jgi:hypothetical protein
MWAEAMMDGSAGLRADAPFLAPGPWAARGGPVVSRSLLTVSPVNGHALSDDSTADPLSARFAPWTRRPD